MEITRAKHYAGDRAQEIEPTLVVTATTGVRFRVRILRQGTPYGLDHRLAWEHEQEGVEFYDTRFQDIDEKGYGQFISRYFVDTLLGIDKWGDGIGGLDLMGYVDDWKIDGVAMDVVRSWIRLERNRVLVDPEPADA